MQYFPIFIDLENQPVLVVGGGAVAERKIRLLMAAGARVLVVAQSLSTWLSEQERKGGILFISKNYESGQLRDTRLVFAATNNRELNHRIYRDAERQGVMANVVDDKAHCRFISPAIVDRSPVLVAISTGGTSPVLARKIRRWIEQLLPLGLGKVAAAAGRARDMLKRKSPHQDLRLLWERLLSDSNIRKWSSQRPESIAKNIQSGLRKCPEEPRSGMVYLVGAGPGNPDLLTIRALDVLGRADVVLHDRLVSDEILDLARRDADRVYVGKASGNHHYSQEEINRIMVSQARLGKIVVRLKGGDAFIFGRGGEELEVLEKAGIGSEVVPGITAATGCAAFAGIPLTHRDLAQSVTFITGHQALAKAGHSRPADWSQIAGRGKTTVIYMGVKQAHAIRSGLLEAGISPSLPVALIENGTRQNQKVFVGTVATISNLAGKADRGAPGLLIVGQVAALAAHRGWNSGSPAVASVAAA